MTYEPDMQLSFFDDPEDDEKEKNIEVAMIDIPYTLYMVYTTMLILTYAEYFFGVPIDFSFLKHNYPLIPNILSN